MHAHMTSMAGWMMRRGFASAASSRPPPPPSSSTSSTPRVSRSSLGRPTRPASFNPPGGDPAAFLAELKSFASRHPRHRAEDLSSLLPLSFSGDASLLLSGERRVVSSTSEFDFACTGCGACCRSYPNDVMLDSHDVWLVSRAADAGLASTTDMHRLFPRAFQTQLGIFESAPHVVEEQRRSGAPMASLHKLAPVMFLRTKRVKQTSKQSGAVRIEERCWFSYSAEKTQVPMADDAPVEGEVDASSSAPGVVRPPSRKTPAGNSTTAGLRCRLGPAHQPTACALYPLGELYTSDGTAPASPSSAAAPTAASASASGPATVSPSAPAKYYSLDVTNCEGTRVRSTASTRTTVAGYEERNGLVQRRAEWEWFERELARPFAARGWLSLQPDSGALPASTAVALTPEFRDKLADVLFTLWYDFDSLECAPSTSTSAVARFPDWPSARAAITDATQRLTEATEAYIAECASEDRADNAEQRLAAAADRWLDRLRMQGLLKRDASK